MIIIIIIDVAVYYGLQSSQPPRAQLGKRGFIVHNACAYHGTSDIIYPDWLIWVVANWMY